MTEQQRTININEKTAGDGSIFVGNKPLVNYVRGVRTQFMKYSFPEVVIRSRGKFISKAVDVAEIVRRSSELNIFIKDIQISSDRFETDGKTTTISTMSIVLGKK